MELHQVLQLIQNRLKDGSRPRNRSDRAKLGLVIEGGGMRGVVSAGMLMELAELGLRPVFDAVFGASAGAINGAYFLASRPRPGIGLYQQLNNSDFINLGRLAKDRPALNLDYLFSLIASGPDALNCRALLESPQEFRAVATSLRRLRPVALGDFQTREELIQSLRASAAVPFMAESPLRLKGDLFIDGSILDAVPFHSAIQDGCTHVLALLSKPAHNLEPPHTAIKQRLTMACLETIRSGLGTAYREFAARRKEEMRRYSRTDPAPQGPPFVYLVDPPPEARWVRRLEKSLPKLVAGACLGRSALRNHLRALLKDPGRSSSLGNP